MLELKRIDCDFTVCKVKSYDGVDWNQPFCFAGKTDEECSLVCAAASVPENVLERDDGWRAFRIQGVLDFSLIGILSRISAILAEGGVGIFAISTFNTDYILVKEAQYERALSLLEAEGYRVL